MGLMMMAVVGLGLELWLEDRRRRLRREGMGMEGA